MNISFTPLTGYYTFTGKQVAQKPKDEYTADTFEKKKDDIPEKISDKTQINNFAEFYLSIEDEDSRKMIRYCLQDNEERYGEILDKLDEAEGIDRNAKEKKSFARKFLDLMLLPKFFDIDARDEAAELAKLPFFDDGKNKDTLDILLELATPPIEERNEQDIEEEIKNADVTMDITNDIKEVCKPKPDKVGILRRAVTLISIK